MKHAQKYTKQYNNNETWHKYTKQQNSNETSIGDTLNIIIIMKHAQKYTKPI